jgi:galactose mutarotase-like enzyme
MPAEALSADPASVTLESDALRVVCTPARGFSIRSLVDRASGLDALWTGPSHAPAACSRTLGPAGVASEETFLDLFGGGWFEMFPEVGYTQPGDLSSFLHGEVVRLPWEVIAADAAHVEARVELVRRPLTLTRRVALEGAELRIGERIENAGPAPVPYSWGHHPCFSREAFAGGRIELEVAAAEVPDPWFDPAHATLAHGPFPWPLAPRRSDAAPGGAAVDLSAIPTAADGRHDHACLRVDGGSLRLTAPAAGRALRIRFDAERFPYVLLWENFHAGESFPFWGGGDTFAVEWSTIPGRSTPDALAAGAVATLAPGEAQETEIVVSWEPLRAA